MGGWVEEHPHSSRVRGEYHLEVLLEFRHNFSNAKLLFLKSESHACDAIP